jgi:hypothetical protein
MSVDPSTERFEKAIVVLPEDIDLFDHVNNVVYARREITGSYRLDPADLAAGVRRLNTVTCSPRRAP